MVEEPPSPPGDPSDSGAHGDDDPLAWLTLDEEFIRAARRSEPSASERTRAARDRAAREANLRRLLADEAAQRENERHAQGRGARSSSKAARRRGRGRSIAWRGGRLRTIGFAVVGVTVLVLVAVETNRGSTSILRPTNWPPVTEDTSATPLGTPGPVPTGGGTHTFIQLQPDGVTPVGYDPCRHVHYVTRPGGPEGAEQLVLEAVASASAATGLSFVDDGPTDEAPSDTREPYQPDRYGERWAPVLITWSDPIESPKLGEIDAADPGKDVAGYAGSQMQQTYLSADEDRTFVDVTGSVTLDAADFVTMLGRPDGWAQARAVIEHELGHLVGLDHVDDATQLMFAENTGLVTEYGAGDLQGLAALGGGDCFPEV